MSPGPATEDMGEDLAISGSSGSSGLFVDQEAEARINLALLEPQKWGWTAAGGIADLLPPHEVSCYLSYTCRAFAYVVFH
jgi:hypothetical protein